MSHYSEFSSETESFESVTQLSEEFSGNWRRCPDCKRIVAECETFSCDECDYKNRENLCDACGSKKHDHRPIAESTPITSFEQSSSSLSSMEKIFENMKKKFASQNETSAENFKLPTSSILAGQIRHVADFVYDRVLTEFDREQNEIDQRQIQLERKQADFLVAFRRFDADIRRLYTNDPMKLENRSAGAGVDLIKPRTTDEDTDPVVERKRNKIADDRQIFIYGLPLNVREDDLEQIFSAYGVVVDMKIMRKHPGRKSGCALVAFQSADVARRIVKSPPSFAQFWPNDRSRHVYVEPKCTTTMLYLPDSFKIRVTNLPRGVRLSDVKEFFEDFGHVLAAKLRFRISDLPKQPAAYVAFDSAETAARVAMHNTLYFGKSQRPIYIELAVSRYYSSNKKK